VTSPGSGARRAPPPRHPQPRPRGLRSARVSARPGWGGRSRTPLRCPGERGARRASFPHPRQNREMKGSRRTERNLAQLAEPLSLSRGRTPFETKRSPTPRTPRVVPAGSRPRLRRKARVGPGQPHDVSRTCTAAPAGPGALPPRCPGRSGGDGRQCRCCRAAGAGLSVRPIRAGGGLESCRISFGAKRDLLCTLILFHFIFVVNTRLSRSVYICTARVPLMHGQLRGCSSVIPAARCRPCSAPGPRFEFRSFRDKFAPALGSVRGANPFGFFYSKDFGYVPASLFTLTRWGGAVRSRELRSTVLVGLFQPGTPCGSVTLRAEGNTGHSPFPSLPRSTPQLCLSWISAPCALHQQHSVLWDSAGPPQSTRGFAA